MLCSIKLHIQRKTIVYVKYDTHIKMDVQVYRNMPTQLG